MPDFRAPEDDALFAAVGRLVISWAQIEFGLDVLVAIINTRLGGSPGFEVEYPLSLSQKLRYLRRAFKEIPELAPFKTRFLYLARKVTSAAMQKDDIFHGLIDRGLMMRVMPGRRATAPFVVSAISILRAAERAEKLHVTVFARNVVDGLHASKPS
jgi:hypothetical protein